MFEDVYLVDDELQIIDDAAIVAAEEQLGMTLPRGYHAYPTVLGRGTYCDQIYVFPPDKIDVAYCACTSLPTPTPSTLPPSEISQ